jgi:pimeloyl-ACP methyl ester carboxylesterase
VAVAPFASLRAVVPSYTPIPLPSAFIDSCIDEAGREAGFDPDLASPVSSIAKAGAPVLLIHGDADVSIPLWHSKQIAAAGGNRAELVVVPHEGHESISLDRTGTIRDRGMRFLREHLAP